VVCSRSDLLCITHLSTICIANASNSTSIRRSAHIRDLQQCCDKPSYPFASDQPGRYTVSISSV
jgi:hypothetical protein